MKTILISAVAQNSVIADESGVPWDIPEDRSFFLATIKGQTVIMGRRTLEHLEKDMRQSWCDFPASCAIVLTSKTQAQLQGQVIVAHEIAQAKKIAESRNTKRVYVIGGGQVFAQFIGIADELLITQICRDYPGHVFFPRIDSSVWELASSVGARLITQDMEPLYYNFTVWKRYSQTHNKDLKSDVWDGFRRASEVQG